MNQIFNSKRFINFANYAINTNKRKLLFISAGLIVAMYAFEIFLFVTNKGWKDDNWTPLFFMSFAIVGLLVIGHSFHYLRKPDTSFSVFLLPVSTFEKFLYEFLSKIVLFGLLYFALFPVISALAANTVELLFPKYSIAPFRYTEFRLPKQKYVTGTITLAYFYAFSLAFAGAAAIRRFPLLKTILFVGTATGLVITYGYLLLEKLKLGNGIEYALEIFINGEKSFFTWLYTILCIASLTTLAYAFYKLKEREL